MLSGRAEYQDKAKPKPWKGFTIHRKARNSNGLPALVAALIAYIEVLAGQAILSHRFWAGFTGLGPMGGARLSIHRVGLSNFSAKNTPVPPWIPFKPPGFPQCPPGNLSLPWASQLQRHFRGTSKPLQFSFRPSFAAFSLTFHTASVSLSVRAGEYFILDNYRMSMG